MNAPTLPSLTFKNTNLNIIDREGQQWFTAVQMSEALGYKRPDAVAKIYDRNSDEFTPSMATIIETPNMGLSVKQRIFSMRGAHLIGMFARTDKAKGFRQWVLDILENTPEQAALPETINPKQKFAIRDAVSKRVSAMYAEGTRSTGFSDVYTGLYKAFDISAYAELPAAKFDDAMAYLIGEYIPEEETKALPQEIYNFPIESAKPTFKLDDVLNASTLLDERYESPLTLLLNALNKKGHEVGGAVIELKAMRHTLETNATMFASIQDGITTRQQSGLNFNHMAANEVAA